VTDIVSRALGQKLSGLGQQVVVDNRAGSSGTIAAVMTASAAGRLHAARELDQHDGDEREHGGESSMRSAARLAPSARAGDAVTATVNAGLPINNLREFIAYAKTSRASQFRLVRHRRRCISRSNC
jgi:tripartite-type tricarboxylate transporter receptor subunit TctC